MRFLVPSGLLLALCAVFLLLRAPANPSEATSIVAASPRFILAFPGATGWREEQGCSDVAATDACDGEWTHAAGQKVRVLLIPVVDASRLANFTHKLKSSVEQQGGVVGELPWNDGKAVRMLQPVVGAEDNIDLVNITYLLTSPDSRLLHLVTSLVPQKDQIDGDQRLRDLLAFGAWVQEIEPALPASVDERAARP